MQLTTRQTGHTSEHLQRKRSLNHPSTHSNVMSSETLSETSQLVLRSFEGREIHTGQNHTRGSTTPPQPFYGPFSGTTRVDFMVQGKINRGRHIDHPAGCHSIRTNQCPPPPSPHIFTGLMPFLPPNQQRQIIHGAYAFLKHQLTSFAVLYFITPIQYKCAPL